MATKITTLTKVGSFPGQGAKGPYMRSVFADSDGLEWTTFKGDIASQAEALVGVQVELDGQEQPARDPRYTNRTLLGVKAVNGAAAPAPVPTTSTNHQTYTPQTSSNNQAQVTYTHEGTGEKNERIARAVALKAAIEVFVAIGQDPILYRGEMLEYADQLLPWLLTGVDVETPAVVQA